MNEDAHGENQGTPDPTPTAEPAPDASATETSEDRNLGVLAHVLGIVLGFLGPLIIWLIKKDDSPFVDYHGKEALNFQITVLIASIVSGVLTFVVIGCITLPAVLIANIVLCIMAAMAASRGEMYRYPLCLRLIN